MENNFTFIHFEALILIDYLVQLHKVPIQSTVESLELYSIDFLVAIYYLIDVFNRHSVDVCICRICISICSLLFI
jgi:hypothetical protein